MRAILKRLFNEENIKRIKELIRYGIVGLSTTIINLITYHVLLYVLDYKIANLIALVVSKTYGYFANKTIVFKSKTRTVKAFVTEIARFVFARGFTAAVDYFGLILAVEAFGFDKIISKYVIQIIVIIINYIMGKYMVFTNKGEDDLAETSVQQYNTGNIDKYMSKNALKRKMITSFHEKLKSILKDMIVDNDNVRILDAGCGEGFFTMIMYNEFPNAQIIGCDGADEALEIARGMVPGVSFENANLYRLPYKDKEFDVVVCSEVLDHLNKPEEALMELRRVGRKLLITVPNEPWFRLGNLVALHNITRLGDPVDHVNHWTFAGFKKFIGEGSYDKSFPWSIYWVK